MYPYTSYTILHALHEEKLAQVDPEVQAQQDHPMVRSLARLLGHTFVALGNHLVHLGQ